MTYASTPYVGMAQKEMAATSNDLVGKMVQDVGIV